MIISTSNGKVKELVQLQKKSKARSLAGVFIVEGLRMILEAPPEQVVSLYVSESFHRKHGAQLKALEKEPELLTDTVYSYVSDTKSPQGVLGVIRQPKYLVEQIWHGSESAKYANLHAPSTVGNLHDTQGSVLSKKNSPHVLVLDGLQDPGNLGTIFRTAEAAGVTGILMSQDCVDIYNPKTIRSTMGAIYRIPFVIVDALPEQLRLMKQHQIKLYAAHLAGENAYDREDYRGGTAFLIGNEGNGLRQEIADCADVWVRIPMSGQAESLNAGIAATVLMFEVNRQRRQ